MKKNIIIMILVILLVGCVSYISYDFINNKLNNQTIKDINEFPEKNDSSAVVLGDLSTYLTSDELKTNFKNLKKYKNGKTLEYKCTNFSKLNNGIKSNEICLYANVKFENYTIDIETNHLEITGEGGGCSYSSEYIISNNYVINYVVDGCTERATMQIFKNNNLVYESGKDEFGDGKLTTYIFDTQKLYEPKVINNKLYFLKVIKSREEKNNIAFNYIDLTNNELKEKTIFYITSKEYGGQKN